MKRASDRVRPDRWPRRWAVTTLDGGIFAAVLLVAIVTAAQAGGLFERLFTGKDSQRSEAPRPQGSTPLATIRLNVEGMVCYG